MIYLIIGLILFIGPHLTREFGLRASLIESAPSPGAYKGIYSLVSLLGLGLIVWGKSQAGFIMIWQPVYELRYLSHVLMIPAMVLLVAGNVPCSHLRKQLRNPMLLAVLFWALSHLWSNGDLASMLLFGSFALWAGIKFCSLGISAGAVQKKPSILWDIISIIAGLVLYTGVAIYHGQLFGVGLSFA